MFGFRLSSSRPAGATCENVESKPATVVAWQRTDTAVSEWDEGLHGGDPIRLRSARRLPSDCGRPVVYHATAVGPWFAI